MSPAWYYWTWSWKRCGWMALARCVSWLLHHTISSSLSSHHHGDLSRLTSLLRAHQWFLLISNLRSKSVTQFQTLCGAAPAVSPALSHTEHPRFSQTHHAAPTSLPPQTFPSPPSIWWSCPSSCAFLAPPTSVCTCHYCGGYLTLSLVVTACLPTGV